jgi:hypothetical protein
VPNDTTGFLLCELVFSKQVEDWWSVYADSQRHYDPFANEWDPCEDFDPEAVPDDEDFDQDQDGMYCDYITANIQSDPIKTVSSLTTTLYGC